MKKSSLFHSSTNIYWVPTTFQTGLQALVISKQNKFLPSWNLHYSKILKFNSLIRINLGVKYSVLNLLKIENALLIFKLNFCAQFICLFYIGIGWVLIFFPSACNIPFHFICHHIFQLFFIEYCFSLSSKECSICEELFIVLLGYIFIWFGLFCMQYMISCCAIVFLHSCHINLFHLAHSLLSLLRCDYIVQDSLPLIGVKRGTSFQCQKTFKLQIIS